MKIFIILSITVSLSYAEAKVNTKTYPYTDAKTLKNLNFLQESGVFIQELGNLAFSEGCYHLVMTIDYQPFEEMLEKINTHALTFFKLFRLRVTEVDWKRAEINTNFKKDLESQVNKTNAKINLYLGHLSDHFFSLKNAYILENTKNKNKRGLLDVVGKVGQVLFGTALDSDVKKMKEDSIAIKSGVMKVLHNNEKLLTLVDMQSDQLVNLRKQEKILFNITDHITTAMGAYARAYHTMKKEALFSHMLIKLNNFFDHTLISINKIEEHVSIFFEDLQSAKLGHVNPNFVKPEKLTPVLLKIRESLPEFLSIPQFEKKELYHFYSIMQAELISVDENKQGVVLKFPVIDRRESFRLVMANTFDVPLLENVNTTTRLDLSENVYAISTHGSQSYEIGYEDLKLCDFWEWRYLCKSRIFKPASKTEVQCLKQFLNQKPQVLNSCKKITIPKNDLSEIKFIQGQKLGFSVRGTLPIIIECPKKNDPGKISLQELKLKGLGVLEVPIYCDLLIQGRIIKVNWNVFKSAREKITLEVSIDNFTPNALAGNQVWNEIEKLDFDIKNLTEIQQLKSHLQNELPFQKNFTLVNERTKSLIRKTKDFLIRNEKNLEEYYFSTPTNNEILTWGLFLMTNILILIFNIVVFVKMKSNVKKMYLKTLKNSKNLYLKLNKNQNLSASE